MSAGAQAASSSVPIFEVSVDTGGTFTDAYVSAPRTVVRAKAETTPHDLTGGVLASIERAASVLGLSLGALLARTRVARLSTTIGTNTLINQSGAKVGLLGGERLLDAVRGRLHRDLPLPEELTAVVPEEPDKMERRATASAVRALLERGARIIVIALDSGGDLRERELRLRSLIAEAYPRHYLGAVPVLPSHQVTLSPDTVLRVQTAVLDAYLHPVMSQFLYHLEERLRSSGYSRPLLVANGDGGTSRVAKTTALATWGSGPAAATAAARILARRLGAEQAVLIDVGGTSTDVVVLRQDMWPRAARPSIDGMAVALPVVEVDSIGLGGGSIATVDGNRLRVGPMSAGAQPGPAAFGLGGMDATVTDAACCLGIFDPHHFLGGHKRLDVDAAREVVRSRIAAPLGIPVEEASRRILDAAAERIAEAVGSRLEEHGLARGLAPQEWLLFAAGGGGGLFASSVAARLGVRAACAFLLNPVFSAFGLSGLDVTHCYDALPHPAAGLEREIDDLKERARRDVRGEGLDPRKIAFRIEGEVGRPDDGVGVVDLGDVDDSAAAARRVCAVEGRVDLIRLKATVSGSAPKLPRLGRGALPTPGTRQICWDGASQPTPVFDWETVGVGSRVRGPALVESGETTLLVPAGVSARFGACGVVTLTADGAAGRRRRAR